jgi:hypothetical protein
MNGLPEGFRFGAATAAYQVEGAVHADGRGESIWDRFTHTPGRVARDETGDVACDHYNRWRADLDLMASLGIETYRFSIAWPRVLPDGEGPVNGAGLRFYRELSVNLMMQVIRGGRLEAGSYLAIEHAAIVEAFEAHDVPAAKAAIAAHIATGKRIALAALEQSGGVL